VQKYSGQNNAKASEMFLGLVSALYEARVRPMSRRFALDMLENTSVCRTEARRVLVGKP
jgi:hypothetical protein